MTTTTNPTNNGKRPMPANPTAAAKARYRAHVAALKAKEAEEALEAAKFGPMAREEAEFLDAFLDFAW